MIIERTVKEVIIRIPASIDTSDIQAMVDFIRYKELTSGKSISQVQVDRLVKEAKKGRFQRIRSKICK